MRLAVLLVAGCWSNAQPAWTPPSTAEPPPKLQCPIALAQNGHITVWEADLGPIVTDTVGSRQLALYPLDDAHALVSVRDDSPKPRGGGTLWRIGCDGKKLDTIAIDDADFGHAALHPDRTRLFYSTSRGVMQLDLATKKSAVITQPGTRACNDKNLQLRDTVRSATRDHVEFDRGAACGFDGEWSTTVMRRNVSLRIEEKATPVTGIVSVGGEVWIAAGECGDAAIYRSTDWRSWQRVTVPDARGRITLVVDAETKAVVIATALCSGKNGVPALITRDAGKTWTPASKQVVEWVTGTDFDTLRGGAASGDLMRWDARVGLLSAASIKWNKPPALPPPTTIDGRTVRPTSFGLYLGDERLFPR